MFPLLKGVKQAIWLKYMIDELRTTQVCVKIHYDTQSVIHLANHQVYHERTNHIDIRLYFARELLNQKGLRLRKLRRKKIRQMCSPSHCLDQGSSIAWT